MNKETMININAENNDDINSERVFAGRKFGFCITGSFCTLHRIPAVIDEIMAQGAELIPVLSEMVAGTDTRFADSREFRRMIEDKCGMAAITSIVDAEPFGPQNLVDATIVAPCTGNTLSKLANGITDSSVTMACKATLRNEKPIVLALSTNDGLAACAKNIGILMNTKHFYFVPFRQDDCVHKKTSLVADMKLLSATVEMALKGLQIQPVIRGTD